jgi:hypothetical protein
MKIEQWTKMNFNSYEKGIGDRISLLITHCSLLIDFLA